MAAAPRVGLPRRVLSPIRLPWPRFFFRLFLQKICRVARLFSRAEPKLSLCWHLILSRALKRERGKNGFLCSDL
jgi:hypothetical protein